jgi:ubiquinone biosynthesis monooxygenase Coq7
MDPRVLSPLDRLLELADNGLRASFARAPASRPTPGNPAPNPVDPGLRRHAAALMRVNHAGEIAAQGLYHGQALTARSPATRGALRQAAAEEGDHLAWCRERLDELGSRPSLLNPLWYAGSVAIGALAGLAGDRISLGFMAETERQVEGHLADHLERLPVEDARSRTIVQQMQADEVGHGRAAIAAGAQALPAPVPKLMRLTARIMTGTSYWI